MRLTRTSLVEAYKRGRRDFRGVQLRGINLGERSAHGGLTLHSCDFSNAVLYDCNFVGTDLTGSRFVYANLSNSNFARATLVGCNFNHAALVWCNLNLADCSGSNFNYAALSAAKIWRADFSRTRLTGTDFNSATLKSVLLMDAHATYLTLDDTDLTDLDLSVFANARITGLKRRKQREPSNIDWSSVAQSLHVPTRRLKDFLVATGMPDTIAEAMIEAARALDPSDVLNLMQSTFISYGGPDEKFAVELRDELQRCGVTTFLFRDDAVPGQKLHQLMRTGVNKYDRVILICSKASLDRAGVLNEIEETLQREARDGGSCYLIPIRLDDYVFTDWNPPSKDIAQAVRDRVVGDFRGARRSKKRLVSAIRPLLEALKRKVL